jgi:hypothetical protein
MPVVEWSEDRFVGTAPGLVFGGCHGSDEAVREDLDRIIDAIALYAQDGRPLPA